MSPTLGATQQPGDAVADCREDYVVEALRPELIQQTNSRQRRGRDLDDGVIEHDNTEVARIVLSLGERRVRM